MYLYYKYKDTVFKGVPEHIVREKLLNHDYEKVVDIEDIKRLGYSHERPFIERLYDHYGKSKNPELYEITMELNSYARVYDYQIFRDHKLLNPDGSLGVVAQRILMIEKIADSVDRERNPISKEEFGRTEMRPAEDFLSTRLEKKLARELAKDYSAVILPNPLISMASHNGLNNALNPNCKSLFN